MNRNKIRILVIVIIVLLLLVPIPRKKRDGGSVEYAAVTYSITKYHRLCEALGVDNEPTTIILEGYKFVILGFTVYDDIDRIEKEKLMHLDEMCEYYNADS